MKLKKILIFLAFGIMGLIITSCSGNNRFFTFGNKTVERLGKNKIRSVFSIPRNGKPAGYAHKR
jgi:hypothetical protein